MRPARRAAGLAALAVLGLAAAGTAGAAQAAFSARTTVGSGYAAETLDPPTGLTATRSCAAAPALRGTTTATTDPVGANASAGTVTLARPAGVVAGDVLVAVVMHHDATSDPVLPGGWTAVWRNGTDASAVVATRVATAAEPASYAFTGLDQDDATAAVLLAWSGADAVAPVQAWAGSSTSGTTATAPALTLGSAPARLVTAFLVDDTAAAEQLTVAAGPTVRASVHGAGVQPVRAVVADRAVTTTGGTGTTSATLSVPRGWHAVSLALRSDGRPTPVQLGWTAPADLFTTGYAVTRPTGDVVTVAGRTTTTWSDTAAPTAGGLWTVRATSGTWRSTAVTASVPAC